MDVDAQGSGVVVGQGNEVVPVDEQGGAGVVVTGGGFVTGGIEVVVGTPCLPNAILLSITAAVSSRLGALRMLLGNERACSDGEFKL